jgi:putative oxidoreductase
MRTGFFHKLGGTGLWVLQVVLAGVFLNAAWRKFTGHPVPIETFQALGWDPWFRYVTGALELAGAIGLLVPPLSALAAIGLALVMVGAIITHLFLVPDTIVPASALFIALCLIGFCRKDEVCGTIGWSRSVRTSDPDP